MPLYDPASLPDAAVIDPMRPNGHTLTTRRAEMSQQIVTFNAYLDDLVQRPGSNAAAIAAARAQFEIAYASLRAAIS